MTTIGSLFSGCGGLDLAVQAVLGGQVAWHCEVDPAASKVLTAHWPGTPNLGDITAIDWTAVPRVDILTGGFPCQDVSHAGRRAGLGPDTRSGLWARMADAIGHLRPGLVVAENVRGLLSARADSDVEPCPWCLGDTGDGEPPLRALGAVLADLAELGYDAAWHGLRAADVGAPHARFRVFLLAWPAGDPDGLGLEWPRGTRDGWPRPKDSGRRPASDAGCDARPEDDPHRLPTPRDRRTAAHPDGDALWQQPVAESGRGRRRNEGRTEPAGLVGGPDAPLGGHTDWGSFGPAVRQWERILGRLAPAPTEPGPNGSGRLSAKFTEWMMGLPDGWVCDVPGVSRNGQLKMLGNGVVPQQAEAALRAILTTGSGGFLRSGR